MRWLKRNLFLVVGGAVSLGLLGYAVFFLLTQSQADKTVQEQLNQEVAEFVRYDQLPYYPSKQNIATAKAETEKVNAYLAKARGAFKPIQYQNVSLRDFKKSLDEAVFELTKQAEHASVAVPAKYNFSFEQQTRLMTFQRGSERPLSEQLADIRAFCPILFQAKINRLESIRRYRISTDDPTGSSDYLEQKPVTNTLTKVVFVPYEVTFQCFSTELAGAIEGLMRSTHGFIVRALSVEPAPASAAEMSLPLTPGYTPLLPSYPTPAPTGIMDPELRRRYGLLSGNPMMDRYGRGAGGKDSSGPQGMSAELRSRYGLDRPRLAPAPPTQPSQSAVRPPAPKGLTTVLDEKLLRITLRIDVMRQGK